MPYLTKEWDSLDFVTFFTFYSEVEETVSLIKRQYAVHKEIVDIYETRDCQAICNKIYSHYSRSIKKILKDNNVTEQDFPFSFDIIKPYP